MYKGYRDVVPIDSHHRRDEAIDMDLELAGKRFIVGGASRGIGRAIATLLVAEGAHVLLTSRNVNPLVPVADSLGERARPFTADLSVAEDIDGLVEQSRETFQDGIDGIVVNHGGPDPGAALDLTDSQWQHAFALVVGGPIRLLRGLQPQLREESSVVWVTSSSTRIALPNLDTSNVLRPAVAGLTKTLAAQLAPRTRVNSVAPGRIDTARVRSLDEEQASATGRDYVDQRRLMEKAIPLGRYGQPEEFARVAAFLLSPVASYLTGAAIQVDGGSVRALP